MAAAKSPRLLGRLVIDTASGSFLGDRRIRLLEAIGRHGSILRAAKAVPISYKAAWDAVDAMNNLAEKPLVERTVGGRQGGGTRLTGYGQRMVALYRAMEQDYQRSLDGLGKAAKAGNGAGDTSAFQGLMRRMAMRTSARNQFVGSVLALREGAVNVEVVLKLHGRTQLTALVTRTSAESLGLAVGREIHALVKAQAVMLATDRRIRTSARNQLWGTVERVHEGEAEAEVSLSLPGGRSVTAVAPLDMVRALKLKPGAAACAVIKASEVLLATFT